MPKVYVLFGMTGAGKSFIASRIAKMTGIRRIKNTTTQPKRSDIDNEYNFTTSDSFLMDKGRYVATRAYHTLIEDHPQTHYYGVDKLELEKGGILITDFEGLKELIQRNYDVVGIYIYSSPETRLTRSMVRSGFKMEEFNRRNRDDLEKFKLEDIIELGKTHPIYIIENNLTTNIETICNKINNIMK